MLSDGGFDYEPVLHAKIKKAGLRVAEVQCSDKGRIGGNSKLPMLTQGLKAAIADSTPTLNWIDTAIGNRSEFSLL